jgi:UDPglucose--hexose-1-phosphate uridylyltransferase
MSEIRYNLASKDWVIIAPERSKRPDDHKIRKEKTEYPEHKKDCPFCPGNEKISEETFRLGGKKKWKTRVIANKYPVLAPYVKLKRSQANFYN